MGRFTPSHFNQPNEIPIMQTRRLLSIKIFVVFVFTMLFLGVSTTFAAVETSKDRAASPDTYFQADSTPTEEQPENKGEEEEEEPDC